MLGFFAILNVVLACAQAQEGEVMVPDNKTQCLEDMLKWCRGMQYPQDGIGMTMLSVTYEDPKGFYRVLCTSDNNGTVCNRNGNPWFGCSSSNEFSYKGAKVDSGASAVDDDICQTADKAFNDLYVQNMSFNTTTLTNDFEKSMEAFFSELAYLQEQMSLLQRRLFNNSFLNQDFWTGFGEGFPFRRGTDSPKIESRNQYTTEASNQIERE